MYVCMNVCLRFTVLLDNQVQPPRLIRETCIGDCSIPPERYLNF